MSYKRTAWQDHVVENPKTYNVTENPDGTQTLADAPGEIIQQGTPMSATNFNNIEEGLQHRDVASEMMFTMFQAVIRDLETRLAVAEAALAVMA